MHQNSERMFRRHLLARFAAGMRVLEVGPDSTPSSYQRLVVAALGADALTWHTIDLAQRPDMTFAADGENDFPIADDSYDLVLAGQVLEHVRRPWRWLPELARVCRPGGLVATISPVTWPYHEAPIDCWRIYPAGLQALYEDAGLQVVDTRWESLEPRSLLPRCPRPCSDHAPGLLYKVARRLGWPLARTYDALAIGVKPVHARPQPVAAGRCSSLQPS